MLHLRSISLAVVLLVQAFVPTANAEPNAIDTDGEATAIVSSTLVRAFSERIRSYARWQNENPLGAANAATYNDGLAAWNVPFGIQWKTSGSEEVVNICMTIETGEEIPRLAIIQAALKSGAQLVDANCNPISGTATFNATTLGLSRTLSRSRVLVQPAGRPVARVAGHGVLPIPPGGSSAVTLTNVGTTQLALHQLQVSSPFSVSSTCPALLEPLSGCTLSVATGAGSRRLEIGRLTIEADGGVIFVIPLKASRDAQASSLSLTVGD